ncbi:MAG: hypothetical protein EA369_04520 [Bradymonadales bacterium]|nr:MAG: hypothetical protein EA369_04520 [Bradymonadales bacterium]
MNLAESLPVSSSEHHLEITEKELRLFWKSFQQESRADYHPIVIARSFRGMFELFDELKLNLPKLLHTGQKIEIFEALEIPGRYFSQSRLVRLRSRRAMHFLDFENEFYRENDRKRIMTADSQILITGDLHAV